MSRPDEPCGSESDDDCDFEEYNTGPIGCPPHLNILCGMCGYDVCDDCGLHFIDGEEEDECPALKDTLS